MQLNEIYRENICWPPQKGREAVTSAILADPEALEQLDSDFEVWPDVPMKSLSDLLASIDRLKTIRPENDQIKIAGLHMQIGELIEAAYRDAIGRYLEYMDLNTDWNQIRREAFNDAWCDHHEGSGPEAA